MLDISISDDNFRWLQSLAQPFVDTPDDVLSKLKLWYTANSRRRLPRKSYPLVGGEPVQTRPVDALSAEFEQKILRDLRERTSSSSITTTWQPKGKRLSLRDSKVFANIHPFQSRKRRVKVEVPQDLVEKARISLDIFDHRLRKGWYNVCDCFEIFIPHDGKEWDSTKYDQAIKILERIWRVL